MERLRQLTEALKHELAENPRKRRSAYRSGRLELIGYEDRKKQIVGRKHKKKPLGVSLKRLLMPPKVGL